MRRGFTLIELLVVIAIIAILAAILFPVFARAREKARQTSCLSNVKQITLGLEMYNTDYDGYWPAYQRGYKGWPELIMPYVKNEQVFLCPSHGSSASAPHDLQLLSYCANDSTRDSYGLGPWVYGEWVQNRAQVEVPAETALILEYHGLWHVWVDFPRARYPALAMSTAHNGGSNLGFADGHAKWMRPDQTIDPMKRLSEVGGEADYNINIWDRYDNEPD